MRILQLGKFHPVRGGVEKVMFDLTAGLSAKGVACDMVCAGETARTQVVELNGNAKIVCCGTWMKMAATMIAPSMITWLRRHCKEYDLIHVHHPDPMACLALRLSGYKGKVVLHWHSDILKQKVLLEFYRPLQNWLLKRADRIVGTSPVYLQESPELTQVQDKTLCIPIGILPQVCDPAEAENLKKAYGNKKLVFTLGRLICYKGHSTLVDAAKMLDDDTLVFIGGTGPLEKVLRQQINGLGLEDKVILLGRVDDGSLPAYYAACDVFCLSSIQKTEAFGIAQIEAMSCGKPVVATTIPGSGTSWVNADGESGLNVEPGNAEALAQAIQTILRDENKYKEYSEGAGKRYQEMFTLEKMLDRTLKLYEELCS